jgi:hypothetical protein
VIFEVKLPGSEIDVRTRSSSTIDDEVPKPALGGARAALEPP